MVDELLTLKGEKRAPASSRINVAKTVPIDHCPLFGHEIGADFHASAGNARCTAASIKPSVIKSRWRFRSGRLLHSHERQLEVGVDHDSILPLITGL